jgi:hypothetical protein
MPRRIAASSEGDRKVAFGVLEARDELTAER